MPAPSALAEPVFFANAEDFRRWMHANHKDSREVWVGYYKVNSGLPSLRWEESVDVALCFGWIDGIRKGIDGSSYKIRFTPRRRGSSWSARNVGRMAVLVEAGLVEQAGHDAFAARRSHSPASPPEALARSVEERLRGDPESWRGFRGLTPSVRRQSIAWVVSAKLEQTRERRLKTLLESCAKGTLVPPLRRTRKRKLAQR